MEFFQVLDIYNSASDSFRPRVLHKRSKIGDVVIESHLASAYNLT